MKYLIKGMLIAVLALPLCANAKIMSYVFEGDVTSSFSSSIIADTNISEPATISGVVTYDTDENGTTPTILGAAYKLISVELTVTSQTDVELTLSSDKSSIAMRLFNVGIYVPTISVAASSSIDTRWGGGGLGADTSSYIPSDITIIFPPQEGTSLPTEAEVLSSTILNSVEFKLNDRKIESNITSIEIVEGKKSTPQSSTESSDSKSSGGALSSLILLLLSSLLLVRVARIKRAGIRLKINRKPIW